MINVFSRQIAFLKSYATSSGQETARDAVQIFGGRGITATGMGRLIEHYHRTIPFDALLGGGKHLIIFSNVNDFVDFMFFKAEDVLSDLGVRQALRVRLLA